MSQLPYEHRYPVEAIEAALGVECVNELSQASPEPPSDTGFLHDRFVVNVGAVGYWLHSHFGINIFATEDAGEVRVDPLAEIATVRGQEYRLPHWCYLSMGFELGDRRPTDWRGIARPVS